jgi:hypothetical protein
VTSTLARPAVRRPAPVDGPSRADARDLMMRRRRRTFLLLLSAIAITLVGMDVVKGPPPLRAAPTLTALPSAAGSPAPSPASSPLPSPTTAPQRDREQSPPATKRVPPATTTVVDSGRGTFTTAPGGTKVIGGRLIGGGAVMRYEVRVEDGIAQSPAAFAQAVDRTLDDPRSWTASHKWGFQRVASGTPDFVVTLASPKTVDRLCAPLDTNSYTSCRVGNTVVVNLARWLLAVPDFKGDLATYRTYVINHEVGHRLGNGHMSCPGAGRLAPVMQQQTLGLRGCRPNPWPYVAGRLITGPPAA